MSDPNPPVRPSPKPAVTPPEGRPWPLRPSVAVWLGPVLVVACVALRFGWGGLEGPPAPFWAIAYILGAAGIYLTYTSFTERFQK